MPTSCVLWWTDMCHTSSLFFLYRPPTVAILRRAITRELEAKDYAGERLNYIRQVLKYSL